MVSSLRNVSKGSFALKKLWNIRVPTSSSSLKTHHPPSTVHRRGTQETTSEYSVSHSPEPVARSVTSGWGWGNHGSLNLLWLLSVGSLPVETLAQPRPCPYDLSVTGHTSSETLNFPRRNERHKRCVVNPPPPSTSPPTSYLTSPLTPTDKSSARHNDPNDLVKM